MILIVIIYCCNNNISNFSSDPDSICGNNIYDSLDSKPNSNLPSNERYAEIVIRNKSSGQQLADTGLPWLSFVESPLKGGTDDPRSIWIVRNKAVDYSNMPHDNYGPDFGFDFRYQLENKFTNRCILYDKNIFKKPTLGSCSDYKKYNIDKEDHLNSLWNISNYNHNGWFARLSPYDHNHGGKNPIFDCINFDANTDPTISDCCYDNHNGCDIGNGVWLKDDAKFDIVVVNADNYDDPPISTTIKPLQLKNYHVNKCLVQPNGKNGEITLDTCNDAVDCYNDSKGWSKYGYQQQWFLAPAYDTKNKLLSYQIINSCTGDCLSVGTASDKPVLPKDCLCSDQIDPSTLWNLQTDRNGHSTFYSITGDGCLNVYGEENMKVKGNANCTQDQSTWILGLDISDSS